MQQDSADSIRRRLLQADSIMLSSLVCRHDDVPDYVARHHLLIQKLNDGYFEAALNDLIHASRQVDADGKALPREFWSIVAAAADSLGLNGRAADLRENAG